MRRALLLSFAALFVLGAGAFTDASAEVTRTLRAELSPSPGERVGVENLAGVMRIVPGGGGRIVATAIIHAESRDLAEVMRFEEVRDEKGDRILRVIYPVDRHRTYRYSGARDTGSGSSWLGLFGGGSNTSTRYDGYKVKVSSSQGVELWAEVEVQVPAGGLNAYFRNVAGRLSGADVEGDLGFDTAGGDIDLERLSGSISADTGSGDIQARGIAGSFSGDTGSGDIELTGFDGEAIDCDTGSGDIEIREASAGSISADTGSGGITMKEIRAEGVDADTGSGGISVLGGSARVVRADTGSGRITVVADGVVEFSADTGSGDVDFETDGRMLERVDVDTGSGDATIRMDPDATFHATAEQGSGSIRSGFRDARAIVRDKEVVGYRRGDERIRITFDTGSGSLILEPAS